MKKILIINGPNLNLLGVREKEIYGSLTLNDINKILIKKFKNVSLYFYQGNIEGEIVSKIGESIGKYDGIVINPGAYSHYSIAILDAIRSIDIPVIEIHLSNIYNREEYRRKSVTAQGCKGIISGFGYYGYIMAINALINKCFGGER
ncbi:type II 3-dehydroquinate dehydratase [Clostridium rectalis]|uniref:type II 3-dehydroquinate dehydratase n=1 Tax=Clostridium rectalis TaxID=2040295 RepID=UPI000F644D2A|nr:type II 3-dehydroquinate dehydratase [Clostridium rectalis]